MKNINSFPNFFFHLNLPCQQAGSSGLIIILLFFYITITIAQEQTPPEEFYIGATFDRNTRDSSFYYEKLTEAGMNILTQYADETSNDLLDGLNFLAYNNEFNNEWIYFYSTAYYSKWEAEEDQTHRYKVGFKHREEVEGEPILSTTTIGSPDTLHGRQCWTTKGLTAPACSLMYGPHYHQEKTYKRWPDDPNDPHYDKYNLKYTPRYIMALKLEDGAQLDDTASICRLSVVERYRWQVDGNHIGNDSDMVLKSIVLKASDFQPYKTFKEFYLMDTTDYYIYQPEFRDPENGIGKRDFLHSLGVHFFDRWGDQGVQFRADWLGDNSKCNLYIDYVEVYDNDGWNRYLANPQRVVDSIVAYAQRFPTSQWSNMKYWGGCDEPSSIDAYIPIKTVDAILESIAAPRLITTVYPWWEGEVNGESQLVKYYNTVQPAKLIIDFFPALPFRIPVGFEDWETTREMFQTCSSLQPGFWYQAQAAGVFSGGQWIGVRRPDSVEFKAQNMLALAHGVKGLIYWHIRTWGITRGLLDPEYPPQETDLYRELRDHFVPRIKGKLGKTLMNLDYTGDFLQLKYSAPTQIQPVSNNYLTLGFGQPADYMNWHCGFFIDSTALDDKYFHLTNLITTAGKNINIKVQTPNPEPQDPLNYRFRNVEGLFDTTIQAPNYLIKELIYPPGEGYLYEFAPVVKYGGRLLYNDTISNTTTLLDDMVIENGAALTVNSTYNVDRDIRIKAGGRITTTNGGTLKFYAGSKLIIEGNAIINGTVSNKLTLDFTNPINSNGIIIRPGGSLTISYCEIKNAVKGITSELNLYNLNIQYVDLIDCDSVAVYIIGRNRLLEELTLTPPPPQIKYCNITNSDFGILVSNLSQIVIQQNTITGTDLGIYLSNVSTPSIINNTLTGTSEMPGIFLESCNGVVRGNSISGHTNGLTLGNSSPDCGGNTIEHNWNHGLYIGSGSLPNMKGKLVKAPICCVWYAVSGYNKINENGGWEREDDGSEIFINDANVILGDAKIFGCNEITDQRIPNTEDTPPLYNTQLLMNCIWSGHPQVVHAEGNFWDEHPIYRLEERFGDCNNIYLDSILSEPCPLPDGSDGKLFITSSTGEIIDTLYAEEREIGELTTTEELYAEAEGKFLTSDFENAEIIYNQIINGNDSLALKLDAYRRLFEIGKFLGRDEEYFTGLKDTYLSLAGSTNDSLLIKIFNQLSSLSLVANQEYVPAINEFDEIIQQNPNTEEAVFAEIDALTTALMVGDSDSTLQKGILGKYLIKSSADYNSKLDGILRKHFGNTEKETEKEMIPTEYILYQNYPNPFNPTTTINYDLPNTSDVSLIIYDILGRKVKELVNTKQQVGRYEVQFDASNLSSGVYIYQLITEKYINSKKMILLK